MTLPFRFAVLSHTSHTHIDIKDLNGIQTHI